jgi:uncharacterized membrane protein YeaQ/YmgE (transglycosylase-associated protein family)
MHVLISIAIGAVMGLISALVTKTEGWIAFLVDVALGIVGAVPAAWFLEPLGRGQHPDQPEIVGALFGALALLALAKLIAPPGKR